MSLDDLNMNCEIFHTKLLMSAACSELLETKLLRASALLFLSQTSEPRACLSSEPGTVAVGVSLMIYEQRDGNGTPFLQSLVETYIHHKCPSWYGSLVVNDLKRQATEAIKLSFWPSFPVPLVHLKLKRSFYIYREFISV